MTLGWEVAGWGSGHCGLRCRHIHPGGRGARQRGSGSCHLARCPSSPTHRGNGAASKPEVPAPESESQLLLLTTTFKVTCVLPALRPLQSFSRHRESPPLPHFPLPLPKSLNPRQSATTPAHSHVSLPGFSNEAPSPLAEVVPHRCQCSNHCCPRSPSRSLRSPGPAPPPKTSSHGHPLLPVYQPLWPRSSLSLCLSSASATAFTSPPPVPEFFPPPPSRSPLISPARLPELSNQSSPNVSQSQ